MCFHIYIVYLLFNKLVKIYYVECVCVYLLYPIRESYYLDVSYVCIILNIIKIKINNASRM